MLAFAFQLTAARRRLGITAAGRHLHVPFQLTAARRRLATLKSWQGVPPTVSTHSRPKAAGCWMMLCLSWPIVSTHSRPKAAGYVLASSSLFRAFQLTAARRRLGFVFRHRIHVKRVSTHSRPKAAGLSHLPAIPAKSVSTHSRPKAAGNRGGAENSRAESFQLTAARRRLAIHKFRGVANQQFQLTAARRRLAATIF